jgi:hypothetical protein
MSAAPIPTPASTSSIPATRGPPKSAENAEKEPAVLSTARSRGPGADREATATPTAEPRAISGAPGPSTEPKASVPSAASAIPGPYSTGVGSTPSPSSGRGPPSPGRAVGRS